MRNQENELSEENLALIFKHIDKSFDEAQHTGQLNLSAKKLTGLPRSVTQFDLSDLHFADFSKNCLHHFPNFIFNFLSLEELDVHRNSIKAIPNSISQLKNILILNIKSNQLTTFPAHACTLPHLQVLSLSSNKISSLSPDIHLLSSLMLLDVSNNLLTDLPDTINKLKSLKSLDLHKNQLTLLHPGLSELSLIRLDISVNHITHLPTNLHLIKSLEVLNIDNNPLILPPPHVVIKGKEHVLAYLRRLKVEQNKRRLNEVVIRSPKHEAAVSSWSSTVLAHRRQDSDTCLNRSSHFFSTPSNTCMPHRHKFADKPPYATSTIDVASHRRNKHAYKHLYQHITTLSRDDSSAESSRRERVYNHSSDKKPPFGRVPSFNSKQVSMIDLSKQIKNTSVSNSSEQIASKQHRISRSMFEGDDESLQSFSSADSSTTLSGGSSDGRSLSVRKRDSVMLVKEKGSVGVKKEEIGMFGAKEDKFGKIRAKGVELIRGGGMKKYNINGGESKRGTSIEETIKLTLISMQRKQEPIKHNSNTSLMFNVSHNDGFGRSDSEDTSQNSTAKVYNGNDDEDDDEEEEEDDEDEEEDVSEYGDGINDENDEEDGKDEKEMEGKKKEKRRGNHKQLKLKIPSNKQEEEEFVRKATDLRQQRETEARKIKKSLTSPPLDSSISNHVGNKGLSQKCQQMLEALSDQLNSHDPVLTIRRNLQHSASQKLQARKLKKTIEDMLNLRLQGDIGACLTDGVLLCRLANQIFPGSVTKIHTSSPHKQKLSEAKSRKNVENFLIACRKLGIPKESKQSFEQALQTLASSVDKLLQHLETLEAHNGHNGHLENGHSSPNHNQTPSSPDNNHTSNGLSHHTTSLTSPSHPSLRDQSLAYFCAFCFLSTCLALFLFPLPE